jgi:hypothetical protein
VRSLERQPLGNRGADAATRPGHERRTAADTRVNGYSTAPAFGDTT